MLSVCVWSAFGPGPNRVSGVRSARGWLVTVWSLVALNATAPQHNTCPCNPKSHLFTGNSACEVGHRTSPPRPSIEIDDRPTPPPQLVA
eukprot:5331262-Alexandrium_andersonii.AAC.1